MLTRIDQPLDAPELLRLAQINLLHRWIKPQRTYDNEPYFVTRVSAGVPTGTLAALQHIYGSNYVPAPHPTVQLEAVAYTEGMSRHKFASPNRWINFLYPMDGLWYRYDGRIGSGQPEYSVYFDLVRPPVILQKAEQLSLF